MCVEREGNECGKEDKVWERKIETGKKDRMRKSLSRKKKK